MLEKPKKEDLEFLSGLFEKKKLKSVIDKKYSLEEAADAFRYLGEGHARGKIIVNVI